MGFNILKNKLIKLSFVVFAIAHTSCLSLEKETDVGLGDQTYSLAIPLVNSKITVGQLAELAKGNVSLEITPEGKTIVNYNGEVIRRAASSIFPPFPSIGENPILDTVFNLPLPFNNTYLIRKATFKDTKINFIFEHDLPEDIDIIMRILEVRKDGKIYEEKFTLKHNVTLPTKLISPQKSLDGWQIISDDNSLTFQYEAKRKNGERIVLKKVAMLYDLILFSYIEGYLGYHEFAVQGGRIDVSLFNKWLSGGFNFDDPKVRIRVDNSFGVPVRSKVNKMELTSITGNTVNLESIYINQGIDFNYPFLNEIGQLKSTYFAFDKTNSNIKELFNEKTKTIEYDISALINPDKDITIPGYINNDSYFTVYVDVNVPMNGSVRDLVLTDTLDFKSNLFDNILKSELKIITSNDFPADVLLQVILLDKNGQKIGELFENNGLSLDSPGLDSNGKTLPSTKQILNLSINENKIALLKNTQKLAIVGYINTLDSNNGRSLWIYEDYGIELQIGALLDYKN